MRYYLIIVQLAFVLHSCDGIPISIDYDDTPIDQSAIGLAYNEISVVDTIVMTGNGPRGINIYRSSEETIESDFLMMNTSNQKPLVILLHSGAFVFGSKDNFVITKFAEDLAREGYTSVSSNYSLLEGKLEALGNKEYRLQSIGQSIEDIAHLIKHFYDNSAEYKIDSSRISVIGFSAGGIIASHLVFTDSEELQAFFGNQSEVISEIRKKNILHSVVSIAGGVMNISHIDDKSLRKVNMLSIHGVNDCIVPYGFGSPFVECLDKDDNIFLPTLIYGPNVSPNSLYIPSWLKTIPTEWIFSDELCGGGCISERIGRNRNFYFVPVNNGGHTFMLTHNKKSFSSTYLATLDAILSFISLNNTDF